MALPLIPVNNWQHLRRKRRNQYLRFTEWRSICEVSDFLVSSHDNTLTVPFRIQNPLMHMSESECIQDVHTFATEHGFEAERDLLLKGALISRDPANFASVLGMTEDEKSAIANEVLHKWRQPKILYFTIILCSVGAAVQGW
jgi:hypothetical protein